MENKKITQKWGFGMAPLKKQTEINYKKSVSSVNKFLNGVDIPKEVLLTDLSVYKGLINRIIRQDQWDWFTVFEMFGEPDLIILRQTSKTLVEIRRLVKEDTNYSIILETNFKDLKLLSEIFLGLRKCKNSDSTLSGYLYMLSTRENKEIIKIGMTTRNVVSRVKEINAATGVVIPYSPRRVFKVKNAELAEKLVFEALAEYRIRSDREFFHIDYIKAVKIAEDVLNTSKLVYMTEYYLAFEDYIKYYNQLN